MIIKCPNCGAALVYDEKSDHIICEYCDSSFDVNEIKAKPVHMGKMTKEDIRESGLDDDSYMGLNVYSCTSCGGQIRVNGVEASTFCSFCGQPTVIFDRVEKSLKPKYILPFSLPKEKVETIVRKKLQEGYFVPNEIKNFKTECIRGIYIPFWLVDLDYKGAYIIKGSHKRGKTTVTTYYYRKGRALFKKITLDASRQLSDESSQRLEPYHLDSIQPFSINYLTGFYADTLDVEAKDITSLAKNRAKSLFDKEIKTTVKDSNLSIVKEAASAKVVDKEYALLPVWFLSFHDGQIPYTYLVNGQTGKVIGAVNFNHKRANVLFVTLGILFSIASSVLMYGVLNMEESFKALLFIVACIVFFWVSGFGFKTTIEENMKLSQSENMFNLVKKRQGRR